MAFERELVLLLPRDAVFFGHQLAGNAHVIIFVNVPQPVGDHRIENFLIAKTKSAARALQQIRAVRHGLHPARDHHFRFAKLHRLRRQSHRFQSRPANFVDRHRRNARIQPAAQRRLPRRVLSQPCLHHIPHDGFVHQVRLDSRAPHSFRDCFRAKLRRGKRRKPAHEFPNRCAHRT